MHVGIETAKNTALHEHGANSTSADAKRSIVALEVDAEVRELGDTEGQKGIEKANGRLSRSA
jgi:hypothetical protein